MRPLRAARPDRAVSRPPPFSLRRPRARRRWDAHLPLRARTDGRSPSGSSSARATGATPGGGRGGPARLPAGRRLVLQDRGAAGRRARRRRCGPGERRCCATSTAHGPRRVRLPQRPRPRRSRVRGRGRRDAPPAACAPAPGGRSSPSAAASTRSSPRRRCSGGIPTRALFVVAPPTGAVRGHRAGGAAHRAAGRPGRPGTSTRSCSSRRPSRVPPGPRAGHRHPHRPGRRSPRAAAASTRS